VKGTKLTFRARGLYLGPSELTAPDGGMTQADNVVISREGIVETRRGEDVVSTKALTRLFPWKDSLIGHGGSTLSRSEDDGATWTDYAGSIAPQSGEPLRACEAVGNLLVTDSGGVKRLDSLTGTPEAAGVPAGLDLSLELVSTGTPSAMPTATMLGYRMALGKKDANGRLLLGEPSGRAVISNSSGSLRDVGVTGSLPWGLDSSYFLQIYRSAPSITATTDPGDQLGLVYESTVPTEKAITQLSRTTNVVTATTSTAHGYSVGQIVRVGPGGSNGGNFAAAGTVAATTPDGAAWTPRTLPAGTYYGGAWNGTTFVIVGVSVAATSPDGATWTSRTIPAGTYRAVTWIGSRFVAVGDSGAAATSPDGTTWTARTLPAGAYKAVAWNGSTLMAVGGDGTNGISAVSSDGIIWAAASPLPPVYGATTFTATALAWTGSLWRAFGQSTGPGFSWDYASSDNGGTWTNQYGFSPINAVAVAGTVVVLVTSNNKAYRSTNSGASWEAPASLPGAGLAVAWDGSQFIIVGTDLALTSTDGASWTTQSIAVGTYSAAISGGAVFSAGEFTLTGVPLSTTFTYAETGTDGTLVQAQTVQPITFYYKDVTPDGFLGASLYTNPNQDGILNANARPPLCKELAQFRNSVFYANVTIPAFGTIDYLGGAANDDTVTVNGVVFTAKASESVANKQFQLHTTGTVSENIRDTAASLVRCVNRTLSSGATAVIVSDTNDIPGRILVTSSSASSTLTVAVSRAASWSPSAGLSLSPTVAENGLVWSKTDQPDHVQKSLWLVPVRVGATDKPILRVVPTRASLFIFKADGLWRLTGDAGVWDIQPFDPTVRLAAPESCGVVNNSIFCLTDSGVVRVADTGVALISRQPDRCDIEPVTQAALTPTMRPVTKSYAVGVGYESDHKYLLWLPEASTDTQATNGYVYDLFTSAWTRRTDNASHALVDPYADRLYTVDGTSCWQERKSQTYTDLAGRSYAVTISSGGGTASIVLASAANVAAGDAISQGAAWAVVTAKNSNTLTLDRAAAFTNAAATSYSAIATAVTWAPSLGASPAYLTEFQEVALHFDAVYFVAASVGFATNFYPTAETVTVAGSDHGFAQTTLRPFALRIWPTRNTGMGSYLYVTWTHAQAWCPNSVSALTVQFASSSAEVSG
jgi:hypothetical protein